MKTVRPAAPNVQLFLHAVLISPHAGADTGGCWLVPEALMDAAFAEAAKWERTRAE